jgi:hypothetical protein
VVVVPLNGGCGLLEADIVETSKGSTADVFNGVIRDQELLLWKKIQQLVHPYNNIIQGKCFQTVSGVPWSGKKR